MNIISLIIVLIATFIFICAIKVFMEVFFHKYRKSNKVIILSYSLYVVLMLLYLFVIQNFALAHPLFPIFHPALMISAYFIIARNFVATNLKRLVAALSFYMLVFAIEITVMNSVALFILVPLNLSLDILSWNFVFLLLVHLAVYLFCRWLRRLENIKKDIHLPNFWRMVCLTQLLFIGAIFSVTIWPLMNAFLNALIIFAFNIFILYLYNSIAEAYEEKLKVELHAREKQYYLSQSEMMTESVEQMKAFKHDIRNHLVTLMAYTEQGNSAEALTYFNQLLIDVEANEVYSDTGNIPFDSIINYKLRNAKQDQIKLTLKFSMPQKLQMEASDVIKILGNLLDNALEAVEKVADKWINLDIEFSRGCLFIKIENPFDGVVAYSEITEQVISSKDTNNRGYGLKNVSQAVDHYDGEMRITHDNHIFAVTAILYVND